VIILNNYVDKDTKLLQEALADVFKAAAEGEGTSFAGPGEKQEPLSDVYTASDKEKGQRREGLSMLSNVERFLASAGDADGVAIVHDAIKTMYMRVVNHVESDDDDDIPRGGHDEIDDEPYRGETDEEKWG